MDGPGHVRETWEDNSTQARGHQQDPTWEVCNQAAAHLSTWLSTELSTVQPCAANYCGSKVPTADVLPAA